MTYTMNTLCRYCGWGDQIVHVGGEVRPSCATSAAAMACDLNLINVGKFCLRFRHEPIPDIVHSRRWQGIDGKGDSFEVLERVE